MCRFAHVFTPGTRLDVRAKHAVFDPSAVASFVIRRRDLYDVETGPALGVSHEEVSGARLRKFGAFGWCGRTGRPPFES
jgi:hypothetical protein